MKLSLHNIGGLPAFLAPGTHAPNIFFGRVSSFALYTLPRNFQALFVMKSVMGGMHDVTKPFSHLIICNLAFHYLVHPDSEDSPDC